MRLKPDFSWTDAADAVHITVPLKGAARADVDVFATDVLLRVNFAPYLLQLDLLHPVDETRLVAKIRRGTLHLKLPKAEPGAAWPALEASGSRAELKARREEALARKDARQAELARQKKDKKVEEERFSVRRQMARDDAERTHIEDLKAEEKQRAEEEVYKTLAEVQRQEAEMLARRSAPSSGSGSAAAPAPAPAPAPAAAPAKREVLEVGDGVFDLSLAGDDKDIFDDDDIDDDAVPELEDPEDDDDPEDDPDPDQDEDDEDVTYIPEPRQTTRVQMGFTPRLFPTPMRESKRAEEDDWIARNRKHLRKNAKLAGKLSKLDVSESDPAWLKGKGDDFFRNRDYHSAVNAYSAAADIDDTLVPVLSNRAAAYLKLSRFALAAADCERALQVLAEDEPTASPRPEDVAARQAMRLRLLVRRGTARCQLGRYAGGEEDYRAAAAMQPDNEQLQADLARVATLRRCGELKEAGDALFAQRDAAGACRQYSAALELDASFVTCVSNRAACHLALAQPEQCVADCSAALALLMQSPDDSAADGLMPSGPVPPAGSERRRQWVLKTLVRRGTAYAQLGDEDKARGDYTVALSLDPENEDLQRQLSSLGSSSGD